MYACMILQMITIAHIAVEESAQITANITTQITTMSNPSVLVGASAQITAEITTQITTPSNPKYLYVCVCFYRS